MSMNADEMKKRDVSRRKMGLAEKKELGKVELNADMGRRGLLVGTEEPSTWWFPGNAQWGCVQRTQGPSLQI